MTTWGVSIVLGYALTRRILREFQFEPEGTDHVKCKALS